MKIAVPRVFPSFANILPTSRGPTCLNHGDSGGVWGALLGSGPAEGQPSALRFGPVSWRSGGTGESEMVSSPFVSWKDPPIFNR